MSGERHKDKRFFAENAECSRKIETFAAGQAARLQDPENVPKSETGHHHGLVQRGIGCEGQDHRGSDRFRKRQRLMELGLPIGATRGTRRKRATSEAKAEAALERPAVKCAI